jgi:hypothetical protein
MKHSVLMPFNFGTQAVMSEVLKQSFRIESFGLRYFWGELFDGELFWTYKPYGKPNISDALKLF